MGAPKVGIKNLEELKEMVGKEFEPYKVEIEKGVIWRLAEAIGDASPLWQDEVKAKKSKYGGIIAPPALCLSMMMYGFIPGVSVSLKRGLDASHHWKFHGPIRAGDVINVSCKLVDIYERQGKKFGKMVFFVFETILTNQRGEKVCTHRGTMLGY